MRYEVYAHINKTTGKVYIGITKKDILQRWKAHVKESSEKNPKNSYYFHRAIQKYGKDDWHHIILEVVECLSVKDAEACEIKWIEIYQSNNRLYGYNSTSGGKMNDFTPEVREKMSKITKESLTPERLASQAAKMKEYYKKNPNPFKNKKHSEESKLKMSEKVKEYYKNNTNPFKDKKHSEETKAIMSEKFKQRLSKDDFVSNFKLMTFEQRQKAIEASLKTRQNMHFSKYDYKEVQELAKQCYSGAELARILKCTTAHVSYLKKKIKLEFKVKNPKANIDFILQEASSVKSVKELCNKLNLSKYILCGILQDNNKSIKEIKEIISRSIWTLKNN
jgi:group I intron endonuclease